MGCDGGTIPRRDELVRTKKKPEQKDKNSEMAFKWKHCAISQEVLVKPIVACELGRLYNKETILEFLLDKSKFEQASGFDHIRGLKDVKELNLTDNPARRRAVPERGEGFIDPSVSDFICPVVGLEMSGMYRFGFNWTCGCVISERALKEVKCDFCHKCGKTFREEDIIILNGTDEEVEALRIRMDERRALAKSMKKSKKSGKHKMTDAEVPPGIADTSKKAHLDSPSTSSTSSSSQNGTEDIKLNGDSDSKLKDVKGARGAVGGKLIKSGKSSTAASKNGTTNGKDGSIQNNPKCSKTFKSLFTTSEAEKLQDKPHWITYNPMYY